MVNSIFSEEYSCVSDMFQQPHFPAIEETPQNPRDFCLKPDLRSKPSPEDGGVVESFTK